MSLLKKNHRRLFTSMLFFKDTRDIFLSIKFYDTSYDKFLELGFRWDHTSVNRCNTPTNTALFCYQLWSNTPSEDILRLMGDMNPRVQRDNTVREIIQNRKSYKKKRAFLCCVLTITLKGVHFPLHIKRNL